MGDREKNLRPSLKEGKVTDGRSDREDLDQKLRIYADSDMCPMHMPGHKRKSIEELKDMLERERKQADSRDSGVSVALTAECEQGDSSESGVSSARSGRREPGGERHTDIPVEHMDITEIDGFDNLHRSDGILRDLEADLAALYRVPAAKISVGGSTVGLLSAITAVTKPGDRVLIARNCHAAVYHAALTQGLAVDYLLPEADGSIAAATVKESFENNALARMIREMAEGKLPGLQATGTSYEKTSTFDSAGSKGKKTGGRHFAGSLKNDPVTKAAPYKAVILTCPTYEGIVSDIAMIAKIVHSYGAILIVDAAHGAHLGLSDEPIFPENPVHCGADIVVVSLHKTLPALTMTGAILLSPSAADQASTLGFALDIYESSSPSYILLASIARMVRFLREHGEEAFRLYAQKLTDFYKEAESMMDPSVLSLSPTKKDPSKIVILSKKDIISRLRTNYHIELEMASFSYALAMTSLADSGEDIRRLLAALAAMNENGQSEKKISSFSLDLPFASASYSLPEQVMSIRDAYFAPSEAAAPAAAAGRISTAFVSVFPPEIPILVPGECIGEPDLAVLASAAQRGFTIHGLEDGQIKVLKQDV